jgi:hypothetical protein
MSNPFDQVIREIAQNTEPVNPGLTGDSKQDVAKMIGEANQLVGQAAGQLDTHVTEASESIRDHFNSVHTKLEASLGFAKETIKAAEAKLRVAADLVTDAMADADSKLVAASRMLADAEAKSAKADEKLVLAKRAFKTIELTADQKKFRQTIIDFLDKVPSQSEAQIRNSVALLRDSLAERFVP